MKDLIERSIFAWITHFQRPFTQHEIEHLAAHLTQVLETQETLLIDAVVRELKESTPKKKIIEQLERLRIHSDARKLQERPDLN